MTQELVNNAIVLHRLSVSREDVEKADEIFFTTSELQKVLDSPVVVQKKKETVIEKIYQDAGISDKLTGFIKMMCRLGYAADMRDIFDAYYRKWDDANKVLRANLVSAAPASEELIQSAEDILAKKYPEYKVVLTKEVDESLIGGYVIKLLNKEIDRSYEGKIRQLERKLTGR